MKNEKLQEIPLNNIKIVSNYRKTFDKTSLKELADSIRENGVLQPIVVRSNGSEDIFELIAGERRVRASRSIGAVTIPAVIKTDISDEEFLKIQLLENIQRENVSYMEEAYGLNQLREKCDLDVSEISQRIGKSDALIYNLLSLTRMHPIAQEAASKNQLNKGVAIRIARLPREEDQITATESLRRKSKEKLVSDRFARAFFQENFGERQLKVPKKNKVQKQHGNDYHANWKKYLVNFSSQQFEYFKAIVRGRTDIATISEAVEQVMLEGNGYDNS